MIHQRTGFSKFIRACFVWHLAMVLVFSPGIGKMSAQAQQSEAIASNDSPPNSGSVDLSFGNETGGNQPASAMALQSAGQVVIAGVFGSFDGIVTPHIVRLNSDSSVDTNFTVALGQGPDDVVRTLAVQPDDRIVIGGSFVSVNGFPSRGLARLNSDGSVDLSFKYAAAPPEYSSNNVREIVPQPDGKILAAGTALVRVDEHGNFDPTFRPVQTHPNGLNEIEAIAIQKDGKILIGVIPFPTTNYTRSGLLRLNPDGTEDQTFDAGSITGVREIVVQSDGKILVGGRFSQIQGKTNTAVIARLNSDGSLDSSFVSPQMWPECPNFSYYAGLPMVRSIALQEDGKILVGGRLGPPAAFCAPVDLVTLVRLNPDGSKDPAFNVDIRTFGPSPDSDGVQSIIPIQGDKALIAGDFRKVNDISRPAAARIFLGQTSLTLPTIQKPPEPVLVSIGGTARFEVIASSPSVLDYQWQRNGQDLPGATQRELVLTNVQFSQAGDYRVVVSNGSGSITSEVASLSVLFVSAGLPDATLDSDPGADGPVYAILPQADGKLIVGGAFTNFNGSPAGGIVRLTHVGQRDRTFNPGTGIQLNGTNNYVRILTVQTDGKILVGGHFSVFDGTQKNGLARLNSNGSIDSSFQSLTNDMLIKAIAVQSDGKILIGGEFNLSTDPFSHHNLARLNPDGSLDSAFIFYTEGSVSTFTGGKRASGNVNAITLDQSGAIFVAGNFDIVQDSAGRGVDPLTFKSFIKLLSDGRVDTNFVPYLRLDISDSLDRGVPSVEDMQIQSDGKIILAGTFTHVGSQPANKLVRYNSDATLDTSFAPDAQSSQQISQIEVQSDGKIIVGGNFDSINNEAHRGVVRLLSNGVIDQSFDSGSGPNGVVTALALDSNKDVLVGGGFTTFNGVSAHGIARLFGAADEGLRADLPAMRGGHFSVTTLTASGKNYILESTDSISSSTWVPVQTISGDGSVKTLTDPSALTNQRFYRVHAE